MTWITASPSCFVVMLSEDYFTSMQLNCQGQETTRVKAVFNIMEKKTITKPAGWKLKTSQPHAFSLVLDG